MTSIAEAIRQRADEKLHANLLSYAENLIKTYYDNAPRIDNGEGWITIQQRIDDYRDALIKAEGVELRNISLVLGDDGRMHAELPALPPIVLKASAPSIGEALYEEAQRRLLSNFKLKDWQLEDGIAVPEPSRDMRIVVQDDRIEVFSVADNTVALNVWIELSNGKLVVHAYDGEQDDPVTLRISKTGIEIEDREG